MKMLEQHPVFNPAVKLPEEKNEGKKPPAVPQDDGTIDFNLFDTASKVQEEKGMKEPNTHTSV